MSLPLHVTTHEQRPPSRGAARVRTREVHVDELPHVVAAVDGAARGDRASFAVLWDEFQPRVAALVRARLRSYERGDTALDDDVDDVVAEAFVTAWRTVPRYQFDGAPVASWLLAIAERQVQTHVRGARRRARRVTSPGETVVAAHAAHVDPVELDDAPDGELEQALAALTEEQRQVLDLRFVAELDTAEIAAATGRTAEWVRQVQSRALRALRDALGPTPATATEEGTS